MTSSSNPTDPVNPAIPDSEVIYRLMDSSGDALTAIDDVIGQAHHVIRIFDGSAQSLRARGFGHPKRIESLKQLLHTNRNNHLQIALHETIGIERELARLMGLLTLFSDQIAIHRTTGVARDAKDVMIIADTAHFWRKPYFEHPRSVLTLHDVNATQPFIDRFEQIWESTELAVTGSTAGL